VLAAIFHLSGAAGPEVWALPAIVGLIISAVMLGLWFMWRGWARKTERRFERLADRVEIAAREAARASGAVGTAPSEAAPPEAEAPVLALEALPGAPDASGEARTRNRTRS
jgi:hypothetical protein